MGKKRSAKNVGRGGGGAPGKMQEKTQDIEEKNKTKKKHCLGRKESYQPGSKGCRDGRHIITSETTYKVLTLWWMWDR